MRAYQKCKALPKMEWRDVKRRQLIALLLLASAALLFIVSLTLVTPSDVLLTYHRDFGYFVAARYTLALLLFFFAYVIVTALGTPGSALLSVAGGVLFDGFVGGTTSILAATLGGTILFSAVRAGFAEPLARRVPQRLTNLVNNFQKDGFFYLLFLRLTPLLPFFVINLLAAIAGLKRSYFIGATLIGIAPMNFALAYTGDGLQDMIAQQADLYLICKAHGHATCPSLAVGDFLNASILAPLSALAVLAILPVFLRRFLLRRT